MTKEYVTNVLNSILREPAVTREGKQKENNNWNYLVGYADGKGWTLYLN